MFQNNNLNKIFRRQRQAGCETRLVLVDGSPAYVATHTTRGKKKRATRTAHTDEADALTYFIQLFKEVDVAKVSSSPRWPRRSGPASPELFLHTIWSVNNRTVQTQSKPEPSQARCRPYS